MSFHVHCPTCKELVFLGVDEEDEADIWIYQCPHCKNKFSLDITERDDQGFIKTLVEEGICDQL